MRLKTSYCLMIGFVLWNASPALGQDKIVTAPEHTQAFNELFQDKLVAVDRTRSKDDDRELVREMLDFAVGIPDDPEVRALIYSEVIPLAAACGELKGMVAAADALREDWPGHEAVQTGKLVGLAERAYRAAPRGERAALSEIYVDLLVRQASEYGAEEDFRQAVASARTAVSVSRAADGATQRFAEKAYKQASDRYDTQKRIEQLNRILERNPSNQLAARDLVDVYLVKKDDTVAALEYAKLVEDEDMLQVLTLCVAGPEEASAADALLVADWLLAYTNDLEDRDAGALLARSAGWYDRFFDQYEKRDVLARQATIRRDLVDTRLKAIQAAEEGEGKTQWVDLTRKLFDPDAHVLRGTVEVKNNELLLKNASYVIPTTPDSDYELKVRLTVTQGDPKVAALLVYLPIDEQGAIVRFWWSGSRLAFLDGAQETVNVPTRPSLLNKEVELVFQVATDGGGNTAVGLSVDGQTVLKWSGRSATLKPVDPSNRFTPTAEAGNIFQLTGATGSVTLHEVELRHIDK